MSIFSTQDQVGHKMDPFYLLDVYKYNATHPHLKHHRQVSIFVPRQEKCKWRRARSQVRESEDQAGRRIDLYALKSTLNISHKWVYRVNSRGQNWNLLQVQNSITCAENFRLEHIWRAFDLSWLWLVEEAWKDGWIG